MRHADLKPAPQAAPQPKQELVTPVVAAPVYKPPPALLPKDYVPNGTIVDHIPLKPVEARRIPLKPNENLIQTPIKQNGTVIGQVPLKPNGTAAGQPLKPNSGTLGQVPLRPNGAIVGQGPVKAGLPLILEEARPRPATAYIFAPRTKDMNKGYLTFSDDDPGKTMLKEEPEDLTHLAPTAGEVCVSLEDSPFDMFDEFILNDNYCSLLSEELANGSPVDSLGTESLLLSSPEPQESDSSCEQSSLLTELSHDGGRSEGELDGRAPYIPMSGSDELPLLTPEVMWGAHPDSVSLARPAPAPHPAPMPPPAPSLQQLLASPPHTGPPPQDIITNIYADQGLIPGEVTWDTGVKRSLRRPEEPTAKRSKRTSPAPGPAPAPAPAPAPSSSVLMNLLDISSGPPNRYHKIINSTLSFIPANFQYGEPPPILSNQAPILSNQPPILPNDSLTLRLQTPSPLPPLSLNLGSPMLCSPSSMLSQHSPMYRNSQSPIFNSQLSPQYRQLSMSPLAYNRLTGGCHSPGSLTPQSVSPKISPHEMLTGCDPLFNNGLMSPKSYPMDTGPGLEREKMGLERATTWDPGNVFQDNSLLAAFDDSASALVFSDQMYPLSC